jgi:hypothetical protein
VALRRKHHLIEILGEHRRGVLPLGSGKFLIEGDRALQCRALAEPTDTGRKFGPFREKLEHQTPAERRAKDDIGGGELLAHEVGALATPLATTFMTVSKSP